MNLTYIEMAANKLCGSIPPEIGDLTKLNYLNLSNNKFTGLTDLSFLTGLTRIDVRYNLLDYNDLGAANVNWTNPNFTYNPQGVLLPVNSNTSGANVIFTLDFTYPGTTFQWYKDGSNMPGQTNITLTVPESDPGTFHCKVNNPGFPSLELTSYSVKTIQGGVALSDSIALVAFYYSTGGTGWTDKTNWLSSQRVSTWFGITVTNNRVTSINLNNNNLAGTIPPDIGDLTQLSYLSLYGNKLTGALPSELFSLPALTYISIWNNLLSGTIPSEIGNLKQLSYLNLYGNKLTGTLPIL